MNGDDRVVSARGLVVRYGDNTAVKGLDLEVRRGEVVGMIGPDGAGKTSSLRVIGGLQRAAAGAVEVLGEDAWRHRRGLHHRLGYLAQRFALYGDLTVDENAQFFGLLLGVPAWRARRDELLERVGLTPFRTRPADRLSGGMKQKLALVCSLMHSPEILLLDEPTTGVDPVTRREFWRLLAGLVAGGLTLLIATPYLDEAERCTRVVLMHEGRVLADAPPGELPAMLPGVVVEVAAAPRALAADALAKMPGALDVQPFAARFHVRLASAEDAVERVRAALEAAGARVEEVRVIRTGLEDTFLHLTRVGRESSEAA
ncbi:MAG TPA: ABC transporter ATP-binding protein [Thermoanaerobaculaceae bacterium]|nr:ABC transporter ATP-binding protein [Thermoanaerobaculaceae bacterium]